AFSILLILFGWFSMPAQAQHQISGYVIDAETKAPIEMVEIYDNNAGRSFRTDEEGYFEINDIPYGTYFLYFYKLGYEVEQRPIVLDTKNSTIYIELRKLSREMSEVAITEQREQVFAMQRLREVEGTSIFAGKKNEVINLDNMVVNTSSNNARQIYSQISG
ncbi:MAG TPA: TonB-dependent receptor, partial [Balneolaceae bacterium]|nr:TonB-dependent receptor [Balneolaceae bacterium]